MSQKIKGIKNDFIQLIIASIKFLGISIGLALFSFFVGNYLKGTSSYDSSRGGSSIARFAYLLFVLLGWICLIIAGYWIIMLILSNIFMLIAIIVLKISKDRIDLRKTAGKIFLLPLIPFIWFLNLLETLTGKRD